MFESMNSITVHGLSGSTILVFFSLMTSTNTNLTCNSYRLIIWRLCVWSLCTLRWFCCDIGGCGQLRWWQSIPCFVWSPTEIVEEIHTCHVVSCIYDEFVGFVFCFYIFIIICLFVFLNIIKTQNVMMIFCSIRTLLMRFVLIIFIRDPHHCRCCVNDDNKSISLIPKRDWGNLCVSHNHCGWAMTGQIRCWYLKTMYKNILVISVWEI